MRISDWSSDVCSSDLGSFAAQGIFGQGIFIDPKRKLVIASNGNWPTATDPEGVGAAREAFYKAVQAAVDRSEEHTSELQSLMRISYAVFCLNKKKYNQHKPQHRARS